MRRLHSAVLLSLSWFLLLIGTYQTAGAASSLRDTIVADRDASGGSAGIQATQNGGERAAVSTPSPSRDATGNAVGLRGREAMRAPLPRVDTAEKRRVHAAYGKLPLTFESNQGQTDGQVKFLSRGSGYTLFLTPTEAVLALRKSQGVAEEGHKLQPKPKPAEAPATVLRMKLVGANPATQVEGQEELPGKANYFIGKDPARWRRNVPTYAQVRYQGIYPGVDLVYYGNQRQLEYDFVVAPGADPKAIVLGFEGANKVAVDAQGDLVLHTPSGEIRQHRPLVYQEVDGIRKEVSGRYVLIYN